MAEQSNLSADFASRCQAGELENGKIIVIKCSNCKTPLAEIWRTRPNVQVKTEIVATCAMCGDKSYKIMVEGGFHFANVEGSPVTPTNTEPGKTGQDENGIIITSLTITTGKLLK